MDRIKRNGDAVSKKNGAIQGNYRLGIDFTTLPHCLLVIDVLSWLALFLILTHRTVETLEPIGAAKLWCCRAMNTIMEISPLVPATILIRKNFVWPNAPASTLQPFLFFVSACVPFTSAITY